MSSYAYIPKQNRSTITTAFPVEWEFTVGTSEFVGFEDIEFDSLQKEDIINSGGDWFNDNEQFLSWVSGANPNPVNVIEVLISNDRKVRYAGMFDYPEENALVINFDVFDSAGNKLRTVSLKADQTTIMPDGRGEYQYIVETMDAGVTMRQLINDLVPVRDSEGRFD
jgi:hypothetical protein